MLRGLIRFYYFGETFYENQDMVYPMLIKRVLPLWMIGFFVAVVMGAVLSIFNSALNSEAALFSLDIYQRYINRGADELRLDIGDMNFSVD